MVRLTPAGIFVTLVVGFIVAGATPAYALLLGLGWGWRLWIAAASHVMSFALYEHLSLPVRR